MVFSLENVGDIEEKGIKERSFTKHGLLINKKKLITEFFFLLLLSALVPFLYYRFFLIKLNIPIVYFGDTISEMAFIKKLLYDSGDALGWPFHENAFPYSPVYNALYRILIFFAGLFSGSSWAVPLNLYICLIPSLVFFITYLVVRYLNIAPIWAILAAATFSCSPYIQGRYIWHPALEAVECVPIVFLMCIWLYEDCEYARLQKGWVRYKKNLFLVIFSWVIANNGMIYYPFFSCFLFLVTGLLVVFDSHQIKNIIPALVNIFWIIFWIGVGCIPLLWGRINGVSGSLTQGVNRSPAMASVFGLNIRSMLLSPKGWGIFDMGTNLYDLVHVTNENNRAYLGIIMSLGFLALILCLFQKIDTDSTYGRRLYLLSRLNIAMLVLSVLDGLGVLVAIFLPYIRCYNRINPFIGFGALLFILFLIKEKIQDKVIPQIGMILLFCVGVWEMRDVYGYLPMWQYEDCTDAMVHDNEFFSKLEEKAIADSKESNPMIFVLPYMRSFENGEAYYLKDYDHLKGYLFTDNIRWSYGAPNGSENDVWYLNTANLPVDEMIDELRSKGITGIYVNQSGLEDGSTLVEDLIEESESSDVIGDGQGKYYIPL